MSSRPSVRRRQTVSSLIVNCAFAEDCRCSKTGYIKKGFMENHLERDHPSALGLMVSQPYCPACDEYFASKRLLIDHIIDTHVRTYKTSFPARAVSHRPLLAASSLTIHETIIDRPSHSGSTPNMRAISLYSSTMVDREGYADIINEGRIPGDSAFGF